MFVGREAELQFLEGRYIEKGGQLVVLYGRRRIGKTETLKQFCKKKPHVFFACRECTDKMQLKNFSEKMLQEDIPERKYFRQFEDWEQAFRSILNLPYAESKKLLVIDEFPYMCKSNAEIPSILQNLWDEVLKDSNIMIILCGSAMSFIEKELLAEKNPLYGRATGIYKMKELGFYDAIKFFPNYSDRDKVLAYSILGGIPHYLKQFNPNLPLTENIKKSILSKGCVLYSEVEFLLRQELRETPIYNSIIEAVALGNTRLNDISQKSLIDDTSKTSIYLRNLIELGIVERQFPVDVGIKARANIHRGTYRLTDHFFRFWYAFVLMNYSDLEAGDIDGVFRYVIEPALNEYAADTFEDICRQFVCELQKAGRLPFRYSQIGRWVGKTTIRDVKKKRVAETEIDIVAVSNGFQKYFIGECKFKNSPFRYSEYLDTIQKLAPQKEIAEFYYGLFSASGFDQKIEQLKQTDRKIYLFDLHDIVSGVN